MRTFLVTITLLILSQGLINGQEGNSAATGATTAGEPSGNLKESALNIFLDCRWCDRDYIKKNIPFVNYVNNKDEADVHILVTRRVTGGGGGEYTIEFIGQGEFSDVNDKLIFYAPINETADETREARSGMLAMGLMQYVSRTPLGRNIRISYIDNKLPERAVNNGTASDPWNSWIFRINASGSYSQDENYKSSRLSNSFAADRVTEKTKFEFDASYSNSQTLYSSNLEKSYRKNWSTRTLFVKSLGTNWAVGGRLSASGDTYYNYDITASVGPALEYNFFPYEESTRRQFRVQYGVNAIYNNYIDTTINLKTSESLMRHYLSFALGFNQKWGSASLSASWANYLRNFQENNLSVRGNLYYRIYKGLSVSFETRANLIHDQLYIKKGNISDQEVLTKQRALKTGYSFSFEVGLSYSFGSIYNNVVNPRFGN